MLSFDDGGADGDPKVGDESDGALGSSEARKAGHAGAEMLYMVAWLAAGVGLGRVVPRRVVSGG